MKKITITTMMAVVMILASFATASAYWKPMAGTVVYDPPAQFNENEIR